MQAAFTEMLNAPGQMQRLLAALAAQQSYQFPENPSPPGVDPHLSSLTSYDPQLDFSRVFNVDPDLTSSTFDFDSQHTPPTIAPSATVLPAPQDTVASYDPLVDHVNQFHKNYKDAQEIDKDVNVLHNSINSLIESFGLDPSLIAAPSTTATLNPQNPQADPSVDTSSPFPSALDPAIDAGEAEDVSPVDFDFDAFLNEFSNTDGGDFTDHLESPAFQDEVPSPSSSSKSTYLDSPTPVLADNSGVVKSNPPIPTSTNTRKRKSDVAQLDNTKSSSSIKQVNSGTKSKKKR